MSGIVKTAVIRSYPIHSSAGSQPNVHKFGNDVDIQIFTNDGIWLKPPTATMVYIECIAQGIIMISILFIGVMIPGTNFNRKYKNGGK